MPLWGLLRVMPLLYRNLLGAYEQLTDNNDLNLLIIMELAELDVKWADEIFTKNQADRGNFEGGRIEDVHQ